MPENKNIVLGEEIWLYLAVELEGKVTVCFEVKQKDGLDDLFTDYWDENCMAELIPARERESPNSGIPSEAKSRIRWLVNLNSDTNYPFKTRYPNAAASITAKVWRGWDMGDATDHAGQEGYWVTNELFLPVFKITNIRELHLIMLHEFAKANNPANAPSADLVFRETSASTNESFEYVVNTQRINEYLNNLTVAQKKLLANYNMDEFDDERLVFFVTLKTKNQIDNEDLRMCADKCMGNGVTLRPNASFAVFYCLKKWSERIEQVVLVCFTNYFLVCLYNPKTRDLFKKVKFDRKYPQEWLSRDNTNPVLFRVGAYVQRATRGCVYNRIFDSKGNDVMAGNRLHGLVNTQGCWMLFRNRNWPKAKVAVFNEIYGDVYRRYEPGSQKQINETKKYLEMHGYDAEFPDDDSLTAGRYKKYTQYDTNHAYNWFFRWIAGVEPFSKTYLGWKLHAHLENVHGIRFENTIRLETVRQFVRDSGPYLYYDMKDRREQDKDDGVPDDQRFTTQKGKGAYLWKENALGFKTAKDFVSSGGNEKIDSKNTWADLFFYRDDNLDVKEMIAPWFEIAPSKGYRIA